MNEFSSSNSFIERIDMVRVEGFEEGLGEKEEGFFSNEFYYVYKTEKNISDGRLYEFNLITETGKEVKAITSLSDNFSITNPAVTLSNPDLDFDLNIAGFDENTVRWVRSNNAVIYDVFMKINIKEFNPGTLDEISDYDLLWSMTSNLIDNQPGSFSPITHTYTFEGLQAFIASRLEPNSEVLRKVEYLEFIISAGTEELKRFREAAVSAGSNLNAGFANNVDFDNIENGRGLFASTNQTSRKVLRLSLNTIKDLACEGETANLGFVTDNTNLTRICN